MAGLRVSDVDFGLGVAYVAGKGREEAHRLIWRQEQQRP